MGPREIGVFTVNANPKAYYVRLWGTRALNASLRCNTQGIGSLPTAEEGTVLNEGGLLRTAAAFPPVVSLSRNQIC